MPCISRGNNWFTHEIRRGGNLGGTLAKRISLTVIAYDTNMAAMSSPFQSFSLSQKAKF